jgi:hypothetical protein
MTMENAEMAETTEAIEATEDKDPIFFVPKRISMVSDTANILSWVILVAFVGDVITQVIGLRAQLVSQNVALASLLREPSLYSYIFTNMIVPLMTGLGFFALLQAGSLGLSMLLEWDYNMREAKNQPKA